MRFASIRVGDIVECDVRGSRFLAFVRGKEKGERPGLSRVSVDPMENNVTYYAVKPSQVVRVWRATSTPR